MRVTFEDSYCNEKELGVVDTIEEANKLINDFLHDHNYRSYYWRIMRDEIEHRTMIDVGSHTEFFYIYD